MTLGEKVLRKKAKRHELKELQKSKVTQERASALEELLHDVYVTSRPKPIDYDHRRDLVRVFNEIAKEIYGNCKDLPVVEEFGSFLMDIFSAKSDLDLSVNFTNNSTEFPREMKIRTLRKFAKKFYALQRKGHVIGVNPIMTAKVPILKVVDSGTGIECDISVENRDGILKSQIVHMISSIDERFQKLSFLMKAWAKAHDINSSKDRTLNSLSIILLVAFHLQSRDPPILPPFSAIFKDGTNPATVVKLVNNFSNYGKGNKESLAELFVTLLIKLSSVEKLWPKGLCASTYQGSWISKTWDFKVGHISVEDFTDRSQNVARAVGSAEVKKIYKCIQLSIRSVFAFMDGQIQGPNLKGFLFGQDAMDTPVDTGTTNGDKHAAQPCIPRDPIQVKRMRPTEGWGGKQPAVSFDPVLTQRVRCTEVWGGTSTRSWGGTPTEGWGAPQQLSPFDPTLTQRMRYAEGSKGTPTGSWGGTSTGSWGGTPIGSWGGSATKGWGGTQQPITCDPMHTRMMQSSVSWGGTQQTIPLDPIWSKEVRSMDGWGGTQQANGEASHNVNPPLTLPIPYHTLPLGGSSLGNQASCASLKLPYVHTNHPVGLETSRGPLLLPTFVPPQIPLGFDGSRFKNQVAPMSHFKRNNAKHF